MGDHYHQPLYQKIKEDILLQIENNLLLPGDKLPTEQQFMEKYNVSRITVSKALNELKETGVITRYPNRGTFISTHVSHAPLVKDTAPVIPDADSPVALTEIACIIPSIVDMFSVSVLSGIHSVFPEDKYICHIFQSRNATVENYLLKRCLELNIAGIVLFPQDQPFFSNQILYMQLQKYPLVLIDRYLPRLDTCYVIGDNKTAGGMCIQHLHGLGHQRFCFVSAADKNTFSVKNRIAGIYEKAASLGIHESAIHFLDRFEMQKKYSYHQDTFSKLILQDRIKAFITADSATCSYLYKLFSSMGVRVPEDVSLMSFDKPLVENQRPDFFTHICQSEYTMGKEAATILRKQIEQHDSKVYHRMISPKLQVQHSTGPVIL